jgi:hypothetical protein
VESFQVVHSENANDAYFSRLDPKIYGSVGAKHDASFGF